MKYQNHRRRGKIDALAQIHDRSFLWLGTDTSIN
jgi:hypothetical protein